MAEIFKFPTCNWFCLLMSLSPAQLLEWVAVGEPWSWKMLFQGVKVRLTPRMRFLGVGKVFALV